MGVTLWCRVGEGGPGERGGGEGMEEIRGEEERGGMNGRGG